MSLLRRGWFIRRSGRRHRDQSRGMGTPVFRRRATPWATPKGTETSKPIARRRRAGPQARVRAETLPVSVGAGRPGSRSVPDPVSIARAVDAYTEQTDTPSKS